MARMDVGSGKGNTTTAVKANLAKKGQSTAPSNVKKNSSYYGVKAQPTYTAAKQAVAQPATKPIAQRIAATPPVQKNPLFAPAPTPTKTVVQPVAAPKPTTPVAPVTPPVATAPAEPVIPEGYMTEDEVNRMLQEQNAEWEQKNGNMLNDYFGNFADMFAGGMMQQLQDGMGEYEAMFADLQAQYSKLQEQIQYFQVLQQYWNMYGGQGQGRQNSPFM